MKECYFDPAMQAHRVRMRRVYRIQARRDYFKKHRALIILAAAAVVGVLSLAAWRICEWLNV